MIKISDICTEFSFYVLKFMAWTAQNIEQNIDVIYLNN